MAHPEDEPNDCVLTFDFDTRPMENLIQIGTRVMGHDRYVALQTAEVAIP